MKKETFLWLTIGLGVGMLTSAVFAYKYYSDEDRRRRDPRMKRVEELLEEAEMLLNKGKKGKAIVPELHLR
ncbi:MAG: hypothetical protein LWY06_00460 [Firmicutes bacterium]|nr:hypothetical protein [Bacillota bacterium]